MKKIDLKYGKGVVSFEVPPSWTVELIDHKQPPVREFETTLLESLAKPYAAVPFHRWVEGKDLLIIVSDVTRYTGADKMLPILQRMFLEKAKRVRILFALGNHRKQTDEERRMLVSEAVYDRIPCKDHDCFDDAVLTSLGRTRSGLDVAVNSMLLEADGALVTGSVTFHYLAGFGGGRKCIIPGIAAYDTILAAHKRVFNPDKPGKHRLAQTGVLRGNPMHEAIMEGIALVPTPLFLINTIFDDNKNCLNVFSGNMRESHEEGCDWYNEYFSSTVPEKGDVVVVSVGGYPKDIDFIQTHKALEHAKHAAKDGGTIIVLGKCEDGVGNPHFLRWFDYPSIEAMEPDVRAADKVYAQTAYTTRMKAERYNIILVSDLPPDDVRTMGITPMRTLDEAVAAVAKKDLLCYVVPEGSKTLVRDEI